MIIDTHMHCWKLSRGDYHWITPDMEILYRDYLPAHIEPTLTAEGIDGVILVQAAETVEETKFLLSLADNTPFVLGVVGWIDFDSPSMESQLDTLMTHPKLKGIRPVIQDNPDINWIRGNHVKRGLQCIAARHLTFDALVKPPHLPHLIHVLTQHPDLRVVLDHGAKPDIRSGNTAKWKENIRILAQETNTLCKLSGLLTEANERASLDDLRPYLDWLVECFGHERIMFGSDWPVVTMASTYTQWLNMLRAYTETFPQKAQAAFWGETARYAYNLE